MTDTGLPTYLSRGLSLTRAELCTALGTELLSLCQSVTADGRMSPEELAGLKQWLNDAEAAAMPAARHLREVIQKVLADGTITRAEYLEVYRAVEAVLPFDERRQATTARLEAEAADEAAARAERAASHQGAENGSQVFATRVIAVATLLAALAAVAAWLLT